jgi:Tol biopolymer transport system component
MSSSGKTRLLNFFICCLITFSGFSADAAQLVSSLGSPFPAKLGGSGDSGLSLVSADGRYVLFASTASNLTLTNRFNLSAPFRFNVFLRDTLNHTTTLVSVNQSGAGGGNQDSYPTAISSNGQFALFESSASDLVANDTNNAADVFIRDLVNGATTLVNVNTNGGVANGGSHGSVMTPDGRYIAFVSAATDLVAGDTNNIPDIFVRDRQTGVTTLASPGAMAASSSILAMSSSESPEITPDGRYVAFYSAATNLVPKGNIGGGIYVRDLVAGQTVWASTNARAISKSVTGSSNIVACNFSLSDSGQFVAFEACTNSSASSAPAGIILRYNLQTGLTDILNTNAYVPRIPSGLVHDLAMTPDGRFVAYGAGRSNTNVIYLWDAQTGSSTLVSVGLDNVSPANGFSDAPVISNDGRFVAFISSATDLTPGSSDGGYHFYVRDMQAGTTQLIDADASGVAAGVDVSAVPAMSADGSVVAFDCANLLPDSRHQVRDVFLHSVTADTNELISVSRPASLALTPDGSSQLTAFSASSNGLLIAFSSDADNLVANDTNGDSDVFVRDMAAGTNILVSVNTNGNASGDGVSSAPAISGDGRYVAFASLADDLAGNDANRALDVFVRDLSSGTTALASVSTDGVHSGNGDSFAPVLSADGRYLLFHSKASNLAAGSFSAGTENLFLRDLPAGITYALTTSGVIANAMTPDGHFVAFIGAPPGLGKFLFVWNSQLAARTYTNFTAINSLAVAISPDGQKLAYLANTPIGLYAVDLAAKTVTSLNTVKTFSTHANLGFTDDGRQLVYSLNTTGSPAVENVYLYDFQSASNVLISQNYDFTGGGNSSSDSPTISPDGRFIAYRSVATNLVPFDFNDAPDLFVYDTANHATILVSVNADGSSSAADRSLQPVFSADSQSLFFQSRAPDIAGSDFNTGSDIFAVNLAALPFTGADEAGVTNAAALFSVQLVPNGIFDSNPTLAWPLAAGKIYQAQFTTNLADPVWQDLPGNVTFTGAKGYVSDPAPMIGQRFYRIVASP